MFIGMYLLIYERFLADDNGKDVVALALVDPGAAIIPT